MSEPPPWRDCLADIVARMRPSCEAYDVRSTNLLLGEQHIISLIDLFEYTFNPPDGASPAISDGQLEYLEDTIRWHTPDVPDGWQVIYLIPSRQFASLQDLADDAISGMRAAGLQPALISGSADNPVHEVYDELVALRDRLEDAQHRGAHLLLLRKSPDDDAGLFQAAIDATRELMEPPRMGFGRYDED